MFHTIPPAMSARMRFLEGRDAQDRADGTPRWQRLRQIAPETGKFLALLAAAAPAGRLIEIGASAGYSTLWLALARATFRLAGVEPIVELIAGDARQHLSQYDQVAFCFLDAEKEVYGEIYEMIVPRLVAGGLLVADNAISHRAELQPMLDRALHDPRVDALIVPIGQGELVCRVVD